MGQHKLPKEMMFDQARRYESDRIKEFLHAPDEMWAKIESAMNEVRVPVQGQEVQPTPKQCALFFLDSFTRLFEQARELEKKKKEESEHMVWTPEQAAEASERLQIIREQERQRREFTGNLVIPGG